MKNRISDKTLKLLRNNIPIEKVIADVCNIPSKYSEGYFRFLCPLCQEFRTATNPKTNLAKCFRCNENFNPIDMVMAVNNTNFIDTVELLITRFPYIKDHS